MNLPAERRLDSMTLRVPSKLSVASMQPCVAPIAMVHAREPDQAETSHRTTKFASTCVHCRVATHTFRQQCNRVNSARFLASACPTHHGPLNKQLFLRYSRVEL